MKEVLIKKTNNSLNVYECTKVPHLAMTPPKVWCTWDKYSTNIMEDDVKSIADYIVSSGLKEIGVEYVQIDAGWQYMLADANDYFEKNQDGSYSRHSDGTVVRNTDGVIVPDATKFPNGMKAVADYVHSLGLKIGIYQSPGPLDCMRAMGSMGFEEIDAQTFADWEYDMLKYDICTYPDYSNPAPAYFKMAKALQNSGRDILYYLCIFKLGNCWKWVSKAGHYCRMTLDRNGYWDGHAPGMPLNPNALEAYEIGYQYVSYNRPNGWMDIDNIIVDTEDSMKNPIELQSQLALYSFLNVPITFEGRVTDITSERLNKIKNSYLFAIDNDSTTCVKRVVHTNDLDILVKELNNGVAFMILNKSSNNYSYSGNLLEYLSVYTGNGYKMYDALDDGNVVGDLGDTVSITLTPHKSCVYIIK